MGFVAQVIARIESRNGVVGLTPDLRERSQANRHRFILAGASRCTRRLFELSRTQFLLDEQEAVSLLDRFIRSRADRALQTAVVDGGARV